MKPNASLVPCSSCGSRACRWLSDPRFHGAVRVLPRAMDVPSDCPLLVTDRLVLESLLASTRPSELDRMVCEMQTSVRMSGDFLASPVVQARVPSRQILMEAWSARRCRIMGCLPGQAVPDWLKPAPPSALPAAPAPSPAQIVDMLAQAKPIKKAAKGLMPSLPNGLDIPALPELPSVSLPSISAPSLGLGLAASNAMGSLSLPSLPDLTELPSISLPSVSAPSLDLGIKAPNVSSLKAPDLPDLPHLPNISLPSISMPTSAILSQSKITTLHLGIFNDGTGNNLEWDLKADSVSNIGKLYQLYPQITEQSELWDKHYIHGIGTDGKEPDTLMHELATGIVPGVKAFANDTMNGASQGIAAGFEARVNDALDWLRRMVIQYPDAELKLDVFGFSRGSAQSRDLINKLFDKDLRKRYTLEKTKITVETLAIFDTVGSIAIPGQQYNFGFDLTVHADRVKNVIHLIAQSEVRSNFDLWSIRCPPGLNDDSAFMEYLKTGPELVGPEDWERIRAIAPLPNPAWEEWILPGMHSDVGGGYGPQEWIPDLPTPLPHPGESVNAYVYRVLNERLEQGATPRGLMSNTAQTKEKVEAHVKYVHEDLHRRKMEEFEQTREEARAIGHGDAMPERLRSIPVLRIPRVRQLNNDLARLALTVMLERTKKAGVRWGNISDLSPDRQQWFTKLPPEHPISIFVQYSNDINAMESILQVGLESFCQMVAEYFHDSRWLADLPRRERDVYFGGRRS